MPLNASKPVQELVGRLVGKSKNSTLPVIYRLFWGRQRVP